MDYGKLAYLKTEDLTRRIESVEEAKVYPYGVALATGVSGKNRIYAKRAAVACLIVRVRVRPDASTTRFALTVNGVCAYAADYALTAREQDVFFMANANLEKGENKTALTCTGATVLVVDVMVFGEGMTIGEDARMSIAAEHLAVCKDNELTVYATDTLTALFTVPCRDGGVFWSPMADRLVWTDDSGTWVARLSQGRVTEVRYEGAPCDSVAGCDDFGIDLVACVRQGAATCAGTPLSVAKDCTGVISVYAADRPTFIVSRNGGAFYLCRAIRQEQAGRAS